MLRRRLQGGFDLPGQDRIGETQPLGLLQHELVNAVASGDADAVAEGLRLVLADHGLPDHRQDAAFHGLGAGHLDLDALQVLQQPGQGIEVGGRKRQVAEHVGERLAARKPNRPDTPLGVEDDQAFQDVVDLIEADIQGQFGIAFDRRLMLVIGNAAGGHDDPLQNQAAVLGRHGGPGHQKGHGETRQSHSPEHRSHLPFPAARRRWTPPATISRSGSRHVSVRIRPR